MPTRSAIRRLCATVALAGAVFAHGGPSGAVELSPSETGRQVAQHTGHSANTNAMAKSPRVHHLHMIGSLRTSAESIVMELLQANLDIDAKAKLRGVRKTRGRIAAILRGFRHGDEALGLHAASADHQFAALRQTETDWSRFDRIVTEILKAGVMKTKDLDRLTRDIRPLLKSLTALSEAFEHGARGRSFSVLNSTVAAAAHAHTLVHEMLTHYLLLANGHRVDVNRRRLGDASKSFHQGIDGLLSGDPAQRIIAAPNDTIRESYRRAKALWRDLMPAIEAAARTGKVHRGHVARIVEQGLKLSRRIEAAIGMYHSL